MGEILQMGSSRTSLGKGNKAEAEGTSDSQDTLQKVAKISTRNFLSAIGSRFFSVSQESTEEKKPESAQEELKSDGNSESKPELKLKPKRTFREKSKREDKLYERMKEKRVVQAPKKRPEEFQEFKRRDRDFRRFKTKYNNGIGNIMRNWISLIYCILILRLNLIKFIVDKFPDIDKSDSKLQSQILLESKTIYNMIRKAQNFSQKRSLYLWTHLERLIISRMLLKNSLDQWHEKDLTSRDWKGAAAKLAQIQAEFDKAQNSFRDLQKSKTLSEATTKETLAKLEVLTKSKNTEMEQLVEQITELKKREVQLRGRILLNMKSYKDLKTKRQHLMNVEKEMNQLKNEQNAMMKEYTSKIQALKSQIEEKEKEIKAEKEEKKRIKANLEGFGDFAENKSVAGLIES